MVVGEMVGAVVRIWRTGIDESRAAEYEKFAAERSLPMFKRQPGLLGLLLSGSAGERIVITIWRDEQAVDVLATSAEYGATVGAILQAGFLRPPQTVEVSSLSHGWLAV